VDGPDGVTVGVLCLVDSAAVDIGRVGVGELRQAGLEQPGVDVGEQHGVVHPSVGDAVAVAAGDAGDQSVRAEPA